MKTASPEKRAARGAKLLDRRWPGWARRIDLSQLSLSSAHDCILGQLFYTYGRGLQQIGGLWLWWLGAYSYAVRFGFIANGLEDFASDSAALGIAWRREINKRVLPT